MYVNAEMTAAVSSHPCVCVFGCCFFLPFSMDSNSHCIDLPREPDAHDNSPHLLLWFQALFTGFWINTHIFAVSLLFFRFKLHILLLPFLIHCSHIHIGLGGWSHSANMYTAKKMCVCISIDEGNSPGRERRRGRRRTLSKRIKRKRHRHFGVWNRDIVNAHS